MAQLSFSVLGPVVAYRDGTELELGPPQQCAVLAALLLQDGKPMSADDLVGVLWEGDAPSSAISTVRTYIYRLRSVLGRDAEGEPIRSVSGGYALRPAPGALDLAVFRRCLAAAAEARRCGRVTATVGELRKAVGLWRGSALAGLPGPYAERHRRSLGQLRVSAERDRMQAELDLGEHHRIADELAAVLAEHPLDERLREMRMLALYRCGRQADALGEYDEARALLDGELGLSPGPALQALQLRILKADPALLAPAVDAVDSSGGGAGGEEEPPAAEQTVLTSRLPPDLRVFAGRAEQLAAAEGLTASAATCDGPVVGLVVGTAGVGKTAFAVRWAHRTASSYPDGQVSVDLRGFGPGDAPLSPAEAMRIVLQSIGVPARELPAHPDALQSLYRGHLADRRIVLLLDNARDAQQVRPLIAGGPGCLVIVTSRILLSGIVAGYGAHVIHLDVLEAREARELLVLRLGEERVAAEAGAVRAVVERCAGLPLALAVVAARVSGRPASRLADIAEELGPGSSRLNALGDADTAMDVRTVFSWSYAALGAPAARLFRMLALHPGPHMTAESAASLVGVLLPEVRPALRELGEAQLVVETAPGCYAWHDLLRAYAEETGLREDPRPEREAALRRLADHSGQAYLPNGTAHTGCAEGIPGTPGRRGRGPCHATCPRPR